MSTVIQFPDSGDRPLTEQVSEEIKALMGRYGVSQTLLAAWLKLTQPAVSARLRGATEWKVKEIDQVAHGFGRHPAELMGGYATGPHPDPDEGLPILKLLPRLDSNQEPFGSLFAQVRALHAAA